MRLILGILFSNFMVYLVGRKVVVGIDVTDSSKIWDMYLVFHVQIFESEMRALIPKNSRAVL